MKISVVIDREGNTLSVHQPAAEGASAGSSRVTVRVPPGGKILSLDVPRGLTGHSIVQLHDLVQVDLSGKTPVLKRKKQ